MENSWESIYFLISSIRFFVRAWFFDSGRPFSLIYVSSSENETPPGICQLSLRWRSLYVLGVFMYSKNTSLCSLWNPPISLYISQNQSFHRQSVAIALTSPRAITHILSSIHACQTSIGTHGMIVIFFPGFAHSYQNNSTWRSVSIVSNVRIFSTVSLYAKTDTHSRVMSMSYILAIMSRVYLDWYGSICPHHQRGDGIISTIRCSSVDDICSEPWWIVQLMSNER